MESCLLHHKTCLLAENAFVLKISGILFFSTECSVSYCDYSPSIDVRPSKMFLVNPFPNDKF